MTDVDFHEVDQIAQNSSEFFRENNYFFRYVQSYKQRCLNDLIDGSLLLTWTIFNTINQVFHLDHLPSKMLDANSLLSTIWLLLIGSLLLFANTYTCTFW